MATKTATTPAETPAKTRTRTPSPFANVANVSVHLHSAVAESIDPAALATTLSEAFAAKGYAVNVTGGRTRSNAKVHGAPKSALHIAPADWKFAAPAKDRGVRLDSETAALLRTIAVSMGLDPNDNASIVAVAKALAAKASGN